VSVTALRIGEVAQRAGVTPRTIRYYEEIGLLPKARRRAGGHRIYGRPDLQRLIFIRRCRDFGFPIEQVRGLVALAGSEENCVAARDLAQEHLAAVRAKLKELRALEDSLRSYVGDCDSRCVGGPSSACVILADLARPRAPIKKRPGVRGAS
jgi:DNA-binding transcriptional MerR regulator